MRGAAAGASKRQASVFGLLFVACIAFFEPHTIMLVEFRLKQAVFTNLLGLEPVIRRAIRYFILHCNKHR